MKKYLNIFLICIFVTLFLYGCSKNNGITLEDGEYTVEVIMEGGSGRASVESPARLVVEDGVCTATLAWSSPNYDYMIVDDKKYLPVNTSGNSVFEVIVTEFDEPIKMIGDTTAMSKPHEVEYTFTFVSEGIKSIN